MHERGYSDMEIEEWMQSKNPRWALNCELGDAIQAVGRSYAEKTFRKKVM